jgi:hypothetical protein
MLPTVLLHDSAFGSVVPSQIVQEGTVYRQLSQIEVILRVD